MIDVGIVILNWNGYEDTLECLKSVNNLVLDGINLQVLVVDNASSNGSVKKLVKFIPQLRKVNIKLLKNKENLGFAEGNNEGIRQLLKSGINHVLILNNDTVLDRMFLIELATFASDKPKYGILSPKIYFAKGYEFHKDRYNKSDLGKVFWAAGGEMDWDNVFGKNRGVDEVDKGQYDDVEKIDFATGASMLLSSKMLSNVGLFDKRYFMYFEDADLNTRSIRSGFINYYVPKAKVWHKVAQSSAIGGNLNDYFITRNRLLFGTMYAPSKTKLALFRESLRLMISGRKWQKMGALDFYLRRFGKGSWKA